MLKIPFPFSNFLEKIETKKRHLYQKILFMTDGTSGIH